jgi:arylsulfatase A-like enzyme
MRRTPPPPGPPLPPAPFPRERGGEERRGGRLGVLLLLLWGCTGGGESGQPPEDAAPDRRPDILLISLDTLRADHLGSYGYPRDTSPFLDRLAADGIRYPAAFVNTHGTPPSHATLFTSLYQETHGVDQKNPIPADAPMLTEILAENGYRTVAVTGGGFMSGNFGFDRGFEVFRARGAAIDETARELVDLVEEHRGGGRPLFAFFHTYEVHSPYLPPPPYRTLFGEFESDVEPTNEALLPIKTRAAEHLDQDDVDFLVAMYDGGIRFTDDVLGDMFRRLEEIGFFDHGVVFVTSDHGEEFAEHGGLLHGISLYEELLHVPLIVAGHGIPEGVVDEALVSTVDVAPTILALAGIEPPAIMAGRDLLGPSPDEPADQVVFAQFRSLLYGVRTQRWKLIWDTRAKRLSLFDLDRDPGELDDVAEAHPQLVRRLQRRLRTWRKSLPDLEAADRQDVEIDAEQAERLKSLGYLD